MKLISKNNVAVLALTMSGALALTANQALAGGFAIREQSALGLGIAFAGAAAGYDNDLSAMFFNPATLALNTGFNAQAEASLIVPQSNISVITGDGGGDSGNIGKLAVVPSTYVGYQVNSNFSFGVGINAPFGLVTEANSGWGGKVHGLRSELTNFNINPVFAYRINPMISIGAGVQIDYLEANLTNNVPAAAGGQFLRVKGKDNVSFGVTAGILFEPTATTRIGIGYRSHIKHTLKGTASSTNPGFAGSITAKFTSPETVTASLQQKLTDKLTFMGSVEWANWSRFKELRIVGVPAGPLVTTENWKDSWFFSGGFEYKPTPDTAVRIGAAYELSPVPDATRTPRIPDNDRIWLTTGGSMKIFHDITLNASYAHIFVKDGTINLPAAGVIPALVANTKGSIDIVSLSVKIPL